MSNPTDHSHHVAANVAGTRLSAIKEMAILSAAVPGAAPLSWGLPSFRTPEHIREAAHRALSEDPDVGKYALPQGLPELRSLVAAHHASQTGVQVNPDTNVFITAGNMQGMHSLLHTLIDPGDEIIVTDPGFASHTQQIRQFGGVPVPWRLDQARGWSLDLDALPGLIGPRTRALVLVNPCNPTGTLFPREHLQRLSALLAASDVLLLVDDPYSELIYEDRERYFNPASQAALTDRIVYLFTFSKIHAMSGWRLGYMILPAWLRAEVLKVHDANLICAPRISQMAGIAALSGGFEHVDEFRKVLGNRRSLICERLDALPHVFDYVRPDGAYYVFPKILVPHTGSRTFAVNLLNEAQVSVTPGVAFGPSCDQHVRMAYCVADEEINLAFDRMEAHFSV
jgi:aspartate/methionine/tyrosine aminotransferase